MQVTHYSSLDEPLGRPDRRPTDAFWFTTMCSTSTQTRVEIGGHAEGVPQAIDEDRSLPMTRRRHDVRELEVGDRVGRYVLEQRIGEGGMGVVWRAHDPDVGRRVALKFVRTHAGSVDAKLWSRLRREAQALARIRDPGVVGLYDMGHDAHGAWLALEYVHGLHLRRWLRRAPRAPAQIIDVIARAAEALASVHRAGLLHRDVKPTNLLVCENARGAAQVERVVLVDFGLALGHADAETVHGGSDEEEITLRTRLTRANMIVGTTHYMSPEQLLARELGPRGDIFSLCVTAYEALFGTRPFRGGTPHELALAFESGVAATIPARVGVPRSVLRALQIGLALDPAERFANASELASALRQRTRVRKVVPWWISAALGGFVTAGGTWIAGLVPQPAAAAVPGDSNEAAAAPRTSAVP